MNDHRETPGPSRADAGSPPPGFDDWSARLRREGFTQRQLPDLSPLLALFDALRRLIPVEVQDQLNALQREFLLTLRALIDWYLERLDAHERMPRVEDIPID